MKLQVQATLVKMGLPGHQTRIRQNKVGLDFVTFHGQGVHVLNMTHKAEL